MMNSRWNRVTVATFLAVLLVSFDVAFGLGGRGGGGGGARGGGGGFGGGGGGGVRPNVGGGGGVSRPNVGGGGVSRPSGNIGGGNPGGARPAIGSSPSFNRPSTGNARPSLPQTQPGLANGNRPSLQPGSRPGIGEGNLSRPSTLPGTRPGIGNTPGPGNGIGNRPGIADRPGAGNLPGVTNRPGLGNRPTTLPGLGNGNAGSRLPNQGANLANRFDNRPQSVQDRRTDLSNRMADTRAGNRQDNPQDWRDNHREDWQNWADNNHANHGDWYHDCWHGDWYPGAGWNHMWDNYPVAAAIGLTTWGVNRMAYGFGYWGYSNPYATSGGGSYDYSQPIVQYVDSSVSAATSDPAAATTAAQSPPDAGKTAFDQAREAFYQGDNTTALTQVDIALKAMPQDSVLHEFRALVLFALKKYPEAAAGLYAVLSAGPGWDWTTLSSLYASNETYTQQLRALEDFVKAHTESLDAHFVLGYHYLTMGHADAASKQFQQAQKSSKSDPLLNQLVKMTTPPGNNAPAAPPAPADVPAEKFLTAEKLVGTWTATQNDAKFELQMTAEGRFTWTYTRGADKQSLQGVFAVDQNNLALEPDAGGTMLAEADFTSPTQFKFKMITGDDKDPGMIFKRK